MTEVSLNTTEMVKAVRREVLTALGIAAMQNAVRPVDVGNPLPAAIYAFRVQAGQFERGPAVRDMTCRFPVTFYYAKRDQAGTEPGLALQTTLTTIANAAASDPKQWAVANNLIRSTLVGYEVGGSDPYTQLFGESDAPYTAGSVTVELEFIA